MAEPRTRLPSPEDVAQRGYFAWRAMHPREAEDPVAIWTAAWQNGAWDVLHRTSQLAELIPRLQELIDLYQRWEFGSLDEAEQGSAYWKTRP